MAVGAVNMALTRWSRSTRQKEPASGVPTGLPSYSSDVAPPSSGPQMIQLLPTTHAGSDAAHQRSPGPMP